MTSRINEQSHGRAHRVSMKCRVMVLVLCQSLIWQPVLSWADPVAANKGTTVYRAPNGVPVVDIATPNGAGLSHNQYLSFDVDSRGLVLNNGNYVELARQSQLAGQLTANMNLATPAKVILNEVVAPNRSTLGGYIEVLGQSAHVIVANPYGLTCNGCGFINTPNVTLTTGRPMLDATGALSGFQVNGGDILITGAGLDASKPDYLSLVARSLRLDGQVNAQDLAIGVGSQTWDYLARSATAAAGTGAAPAYALDSTLLGGMYANRIRIQATEAGVGVRMLGQAAASADDFTIDAAGKVIVQSRWSAQRNLTIRSTASGADAITMTGGSLSAKGDVQVTAASGGATFSGGSLMADHAVDLTLGSLTDGADTSVSADSNSRYAGQALNLHVTGATHVDGVSYGSGGSVQASVGSLNVGSQGGLFYAGSTLDIAATGNLSLAALALRSTGDMSLTATGTLSTTTSASQGIQSTGGKVSVAAAGLDNAGVITADAGSVSIAVDGTLSNSGQVHAGGDLTVTGRTSPAHLSASNSGTWLSDASMNISAASLANTGRIQAHAGGTIQAQDINNSGTWMVSDVASSGAVVSANTLTNTGVLQSAGPTTINVSTALSNTGSLLSTGDLVVRGRTASRYTLDNQGRLESIALLDIGGQGSSNAVNVSMGGAAVVRGASMKINANALSISDGGLIDTSGGMDLTLGSLSFGGANSRIVAATNGGTANITLATGFANPGAVYSGGTLNFSAPSIYNTSTGAIAAHDTLALSSSGDLYNAGALYAGTSLSAQLAGGTFTNAAGTGTIDSDGNIDLHAPTFVNHHTVTASGNISITAAYFHNDVGLDLTRSWGSPVLNGGVVSDGSTVVSDYWNGSIYWSGCSCNKEYQHYHQDWTKQESFAGGTPTAADQPTILGVGGQSTITIAGFNTGTNLGGVISGHAITLNGNGGSSTFTNDALTLGTRAGSNTWDHIVYWYGVVGAAATSDQGTSAIVPVDGALTYSPTVQAAGLFASGPLGGGGYALVNVNNQQSAGAAAGGAPTAQGQTGVAAGTLQGSGASSITFGGLSITLPANPNGYFVTSQAPNSAYLIEINPLYGAGSTLVGSNYLADRLGYDPDTLQRRLGDPGYEDYLIRQQLIAKTGNNLLVGYQSEQQQIKSLFDAAAGQNSQLGLVFGKALSDDQIAKLKTDIVWMVEVEVAGQKVLSPVVYLSQATLAGIHSGATLAAQDINLNLTSLNNAGGSIQAANTMAIVSTGDIRNTSGTLSATDMALVSTHGRVINETTVTRVGDDRNHQDVAGAVGTIAASGNLIVSGNQGVDVIGAKVSAGQSAVIQAENGDIKIQSLVLENKSTTEKSSYGFFGSSSDKTVVTDQTRQAASITAGGTGNAAAQLTLLAQNGNVNLASADIASSGAVNIKANDIQSSVVDLKHSETHDSSSSGISNSGGTLTIGSASSHQDSQVSTAVGSQIHAGTALNMQASRDIVLEGGDFKAATVSLDAARDVVTRAARNTASSNESSSSAGLSIGNGSIGAGSQSRTDQASQTTFANVQITASDGAAIHAGGKVDIGGVDIAVLNKAAPASPPSAALGAQDSAAGSDAAAPKSPESTRTPPTLGLDLAQLKAAAASGQAGQFIADGAAHGLGAVEAVASMAKPEQGQLSISGAQVVSTKFTNEFHQTSESSGTYVGLGANAQSDSKSASAGVGLSIQNSYRKESVVEKGENINKLSADNVALSGSKSIDLKGVDISGGGSVSLKSDGDIRIAAAEASRTATLDSHSMQLNVGVTASAQSQPQTSVAGMPPTLQAPVALSANLNASYQSTSIDATSHTHVDSKLSSQGTLTIESGKGDVTFKGVTASADAMQVKANNFSAQAYQDSSTRTEHNSQAGVNLTVSTSPNQMMSDLFHGNGVQVATLDRKETHEVGNTIAANQLVIDVRDKVQMVGGDVSAGDVQIRAHSVDLRAATSTLSEHKTATGASLTSDGSAALLGNKAWASADSMQGKTESGSSATSGPADRTADGRSTSGKAVSDELLSAKTGLTITSKEERTQSVVHDNANLQFTNLDIDTRARNGARTGDGYVDIGGANLQGAGAASSIQIASGELRTTKVVDKTEYTSRDSSLFMGVAGEAHSAVADAANHTQTLVDKSKQGMKVDAGWAAAQTAADATNLAMGDLIGGSAGVTARSSETRVHSVATSENVNYVNAGDIRIKTTSGDIALRGVQFGATPDAQDKSGADHADVSRPRNISLDAAGDVKIVAAKSTYTETTTTTSHDVSLNATASVSKMGSGVGVDASYTGSSEQTRLARTSYSNSLVTADNVSIKARNVELTGANVKGDNVNVDAAGHISITSVQDTQQQSTQRANWGGGAGGNTLTLITVHGQGGGGDSHDNYASTAQQSGIDAQSTLSVKSGGDLTLTGAHLASAGTGSVRVGGNLIANKLDDVHEKDGLFAGGSAGIGAGGVNAGINLEKVDQIHSASTQNATISGVSLSVAGVVKGNNLQADGSLQTQATTELRDERIAGVFVNGTAARNAKPKSERGATAAPQTAAHAGTSSSTEGVRAPAPVPAHATANEPVRSAEQPVHVEPTRPGAVQDTTPANTTRPSTYDSVVVVLPAARHGGDPDSVVQNAAHALIDKHEALGRNVVLAHEQPDGTLAVVRGDMAQVRGDTKVEVVAHNDQLKGRAEQVATLVKQVDDQTPDGTIKRVNVDSCTTCNTQGQRSFGESLSGALKDGPLAHVEVAEYSPGTKLHIDQDGEKHMQNAHGEVNSVIWKSDSGVPGKVDETPMKQTHVDDSVALGRQGALQGIAMRFGGRDAFRPPVGQAETRPLGDLWLAYKGQRNQTLTSKYKGNATERDVNGSRATSGIPISPERSELARPGWAEGHIELSHGMTDQLRNETGLLLIGAENSHALGHGNYGTDHFLSAPPASKHQNTEQLALESAMRQAAADLNAAGQGPDMVRLKITDVIDPVTGTLDVRRFKVIRRLDPNLDWEAPGNTKIAVDHLMDGRRKGISREDAEAMAFATYDAITVAARPPVGNYENGRLVAAPQRPAKGPGQRGLARLQGQQLPAPTVEDVRSYANTTLTSMQNAKKAGAEFDRVGIDLAGPAYTDLTVPQFGGGHQTYTRHDHPERVAVDAIASAKGLGQQERIAFANKFLKTKNLPASRQTQLEGLIEGSRGSLNQAADQLKTNRPGQTEAALLESIKDHIRNLTDDAPFKRTQRGAPPTADIATLISFVKYIKDYDAELESYGLHHDSRIDLSPFAQQVIDAIMEAQITAARNRNEAMEDQE